MIKEAKERNRSIYMGYNGTNLKKSISVGKIYSIHYFEYMSNFSFCGERHDFWEFICVDKGEVGVTADQQFTILKRGDIAFHQPNEFHNVQATGTIAPNLVVVAFQCEDEAMDTFRNKIFRIDETERNILANIIIEARRCFDCRLDNPYLQNMPRKDKEDMFGAEQLISLHLEQLLIHLIRRYANPLVLPKKSVADGPSKSTKNKSDAEIFNRVSDYLESRLSSVVSIEQICKDNLVGRSQLQKIVKESCGLGVIEYFSLMKIDAAKEMIRTNHLNFTQISEQLGYSSIHYFSRQFKKITGMTPSEYALSIKAMAEGIF